MTILKPSYSDILCRYEAVSALCSPLFPLMFYSSNDIRKQECRHTLRHCQLPSVGILLSSLSFLGQVRELVSWENDLRYLM